jgi:transcriptional regulator with XRE-family HTH domain
MKSKTELPVTDLSFGRRVRYLRRQRSLSLEQLSEATGLNKSYLSRIERELAIPTITTALKVTKAFGIGIGQLLGESAGDLDICVVRKGEGKPFMKYAGGKDGGNYLSIAAARTYKKMEPFLMSPSTEFQSDTPFSFLGEHFVYVLSGRFEIEFPDRTVQLDEGDAIYFDSHIPHRTRSVGKQRAQVLSVVVAEGGQNDGGPAKATDRPVAKTSKR